MSRLDSIAIATSKEAVVIPWATRDRLLAELRQTDAGRSIVERFEAVGASRPVELSLDDKWALKGLIDLWMARVGAAEIPAGIVTLSQALVPDLREGFPD